ncbi:PKS-NRPS hybrid synthetase [Tanacetum coccineum]
MDCTYKTNRFNMPLLDIIGVSCFNTSFYSGFAFLKTETVESYDWALKAFKKIFGHDNQPFVIMSDRELALMNGIKTIFPSATNSYVFGIFKRTLSQIAKVFFEDADEFNIFLSSWNNVVYSTTEDIFVNNWDEFELLYREKKDAIGYVKKNWLPWKEKFVSAWTEKHLHFGNHSSSRADGAHAKIKIEKIKVLHKCNTPVYKNLLYRVSQFALKEICNQYEKINKGTLAPCTGHLMATMGLPCAHKIINSREKELSLDLIHPHWRIDTLTLNPEDASHNDGTNTFVFFGTTILLETKTSKELDYKTII